MAWYWTISICISYWILGYIGFLLNSREIGDISLGQILGGIVWAFLCPLVWIGYFILIIDRKIGFDETVFKGR